MNLGPKTLGLGHPVFIAFEVGPTIEGIGSALQLVDAVGVAEADAVKVQMLNPDTLMGHDAQVTYLDAEGYRHTESLREVLQRRVLTPDEWRIVKKRSDEAGLAFIATVDHPDTLGLAVELGAHALKVMSGDVNHVEWIREMARAGLPLMLDTGNATLGEVEVAVEAAMGEGIADLVIHQVPTGYPARLVSINLRMIETLRQMFPACSLGFSDHTIGRDMDIAAVALGVHMIEKTLTISRRTRGPEHGFSLEPQEAGAFVKAIRDVETALGMARRSLGAAERAGKVLSRRSAFVTEHLCAGATLTAEDIAWRRPGDGIEPREGPYLVGRRLARDVSAGTKLAWSDVV